MNRMPDRRKLVIGAVLVSVVLCALMFRLSLSLERDNAALRSRQDALVGLSGEFGVIKERVRAVEGKTSAARVEGIVQAVDEVFRSLGLEKKVKSLKSTGTREREFGTEEEAELLVERVTMNEMVNIFYRIGQTPAALAVKRTTLKTVFDSPSLLNITMTISFISPK